MPSPKLVTTVAAPCAAAFPAGRADFLSTARAQAPALTARKDR